ncbi:MAG: zinc ABC transporter substrate-binding protein, partial [Phycisphaerales bacterium]|nr:zinc ABC transporter substrate-binding protein [Phycisphaerales bacterium]
PGCDDAAPTDPAAAPARLRIVCTVGMVADIVREVVGPHADVDNIIGEGVDPHLFQATRSDIARLSGADIIFYSGLHLEGRMTETLDRLAADGRPVFAVTERIDPEYLLTPDGFDGNPDPHVWMDVAGWRAAVQAVADAMSATDPEHAAEYRTRAAAYRESLDALDDYARACIATIPEPRRVLITAHDAFNYFGRAYGLDVTGIRGISTSSEAGVAQINMLVDLIVERGITAVFVETSVADKEVRALVEGAASRGVTITVGGTLYSDAMGPAGTYEGTYIGMIDHNITVITRGLGGTAPERGMSGRLAAGGATP